MPGVAICQIFYHDIRGSFTEYASDKYQHNTDIQPSLLFKELTPNRGRRRAAETPLRHRASGGTPWRALLTDHDDGCHKCPVLVSQASASAGMKKRELVGSRANSPHCFLWARSQHVASDSASNVSNLRPMIITIDGPAGAGKSSVARALARRLGFRFLDTGAMYRAVALAGMRRGVDWSRPEQLAQLARGLDLRLADDRVFLDGQDVTGGIRRSDMTAVTRYAADNLGVRGHLVDLQRAIAGTDNLVTEGRDQGTVVFPAAECKFFLTAGEDERARRRLRDLEARGERATLEEILAAQRQRDQEDAARPVGPLLPAPDAIRVSTDGLTLEEVVDRLESLARRRYSG